MITPLIFNLQENTQGAPLSLTPSGLMNQVLHVYTVTNMYLMFLLCFGLLRLNSTLPDSLPVSNELWSSLLSARQCLLKQMIDWIGHCHRVLVFCSPYIWHQTAEKSFFCHFLEPFREEIIRFHFTGWCMLCATIIEHTLLFLTSISTMSSILSNCHHKYFTT